MNPNEQEIERLLRRAPRPSPLAGLKEELLARVSVAGANTWPKLASKSPVSSGWLRRWWPVLVPAAASLVCSVVLAFQQMEIRDLQESIRTLSKNLDLAAAVVAAPLDSSEDGTNASADFAAKEQEEIERLKRRAAQLAAEVSALEQVQKGNEELRAKPNAPPTLSQDELDSLAKAKERAMSIKCINNLKQFGLAARIWARDHNNVFPPDSLSMSNILRVPEFLVCPADTNRVVAKSWEAFSAANFSYEYLAPSGLDNDLTRVLSICPIHGHIVMCDHSVQSEVAKKHPEHLKERDGKLYYEPQ